ncbi:MAG: hypothetical protein ABID87_04910 [Chloroflexota bacterium]
MKCATHPGVETNLCCGKCDKPICPRCMVETPVGARCRQCARLYTPPTYRVTPVYYLRATGTAAGMAIICGILWGLFNAIIPFFLLNLAIGAGAGYVIGEITSLAVNRKRGRWLAVIAGSAVAGAYAISVFFPAGLFFFRPTSLLLGLLSAGLGIYLAASRLR